MPTHDIIDNRTEKLVDHLRFGVDQIHVHDLWHFQHRLTRKILAHTVWRILESAAWPARPRFG